MERAARRREVETCQPPARLKHAPDLAEGGGQVGHVAQHEAVDDAIEGVVVKREARDVAGGEDDLGGSVRLRGLGNRRDEHVNAEVGAHHAARSLACELDREVARAGRDIEREGASRPHYSDRLTAPSLIQSQCHQAIDEVVSRHDAREHRAHERRLVCAAGAGRRGGAWGGAIAGAG